MDLPNSAFIVKCAENIATFGKEREMTLAMLEEVFRNKADERMFRTIQSQLRTIGSSEGESLLISTVIGYLPEETQDDIMTELDKGLVSKADEFERSLREEEARQKLIRTPWWKFW